MWKCNIRALGHGGSSITVKNFHLRSFLKFIDIVDLQSCVSSGVQKSESVFHVYINLFKFDIVLDLLKIALILQKSCCSDFTHADILPLSLSLSIHMHTCAYICYF